MPATATVVDTTGRYAGSIELLGKNVVAAFDAWSAVLAPSTGMVDIELRLVGSETARADGTASFVTLGSVGAYTLAGEASGYDLRTGHDPNGATPDITIRLNIDFADQWYWVNTLDGATAPANHTDLVSVLAHEIGHGLGINGYRDWSSYQLSGAYETMFDTKVEVVNGGPVFTGANAMAVYGGAVPLTAGNLFHLGNQAGPGADLRPDIMNGWVMGFGTTPVSRLDGAILSDLGVPTIFADSLAGSATRDTMDGGAGSDTIGGLAGDDVIQGGAGLDYLRGDEGADSLSGGADFDDINGNMGSDTVHGDDGDDWAVGGKDNDLLFGDAGDDIVYGNLGDDTCDGGTGNDIVRGGQGNDTIAGGQGDDWMSGDRGNDTISGGAGADVFHSFSGAGIDRVTDFNRAEGDSVRLDPGTTYAVNQVGADTVIDMGAGDQLVLVGVQASSLTGNWVFVG